MADIAALAIRQLSDFDARTPGTLFQNRPSLTIQDAYAIQHEVCRLRQQRGERVVGYKLGCTSATVRQQLGIKHSVFGRLYQHEVYPSHMELPASQFANLAIEGELAVRLGRALPANADSAEEILDCVHSVFPVIELHHLTIHHPEQAAIELIASNALQAGIVVPDELVVSSENRRLPVSDELSIRIRLNRELVAVTQPIHWRESIVSAIQDLQSLIHEHNLQLDREAIALMGSQAELFTVAGGTTVSVGAGNSEVFASVV